MGKRGLRRKRGETFKVDEVSLDLFAFNAQSTRIPRLFFDDLAYEVG